MWPTAATCGSVNTTRGESGPFVAAGNIAWPHGTLPVNTHGGSLSEAFIHGYNHILEGVRQIRGTAACQLHMRKFNDGDVITVEPWRAAGFPIVKDLVVNRSAFDRIVEAGGFITDLEDRERTMTTPGDVIAGNEFMHRQVLDLLKTA